MGVVLDAILFTFMFWLGVFLAAVIISLAVAATRKAFRQWKGWKMTIGRTVGNNRGIS